MKAVQQILYKHFKTDKATNIIYVPTGSDYEKSLLELPYSFFEIPTDPLNSYGGINFDLIISQKQDQLAELVQISHMLHIPVVHVEPDYFSGNPGTFAHEYIFPWNTQARSWGKTENIPPFIKTTPNTNTRELDFLYLDVDEQTQQIGSMLAQKYKIKQLPHDSTDFSGCGIFVNLVGNPGAQNRVLKAFSHGSVIVTWDTPFFQEILLDKQTGFLCKNPEELFNTVDQLMQNLTKVHSVHKLILSLAESKFSKRNFQEQWKKIVSKWINKPYRGMQT